MAEPTLSAIFGASASQTSSDLVISKANLAAVGLTATAVNTAESLLTAILLLARTNLTAANFETNIDQSIVIANGFDSIIQREVSAGNFVNYRSAQLTVELRNPDSSSIDPDNY